MKLIRLGLRLAAALALCALLLGCARNDAKSEPKVKATEEAQPGFSFAAYGDSRPMMYLPYKEGQPELNKLFLDLFGLVLPEKVAEAVVKRGVKMIFDPVTKDLIQIDIHQKGNVP
jgi:hypothetical protein